MTRPLNGVEMKVCVCVCVCRGEGVCVAGIRPQLSTMMDSNSRKNKPSIAHAVTTMKQLHNSIWSQCEQQSCQAIMPLLLEVKDFIHHASSPFSIWLCTALASCLARDFQSRWRALIHLFHLPLFQKRRCSIGVEEDPVRCVLSMRNIWRDSPAMPTTSSRNFLRNFKDANIFF